MIRPIFDRLRRYCGQWTGAVPRAADAPLIAADELRELALYARSLPWSLLTFERAAAHPLIGETLSHYRGRGLEFEENRSYQPGDEPRLLNWRLYARDGELHTKVFTEERRPQVFVLLDRRAAMRFATRRQLKVALAARIAICHAWQAQQQALPVGGALIDQELEWFEPAQGETALQAFLQRLGAPCPPLDLASRQPDLGESLQLLRQRLPEGCFVLLLSDFADLSPDDAMQSLPELAARHTLRAIQILDPVERRLPRSGDFLIEDTGDHPALPLRGSDQAQQNQYAAAFDRQQAALADCFRYSAIRFSSYSTEDDLATCLEPPDADRP